MGKRRIWNRSAERTVEQINAVNDMLFEKKIACQYIQVPKIQERNRECRITWQNHEPGRENCGEYFTKLEQYKHIIETKSYHCLLMDGSVIRVNFEFKDNTLLTQNLLWWPSPADFSGWLILNDYNITIEALLNSLYEEKEWYNKINMRSPVRIDFDSRVNNENHPHSHMHIQNAETRLFTVKPITYSCFIDFIMRNFYPNYECKFDQTDFFDYKTGTLNKLEYTHSKIEI